MGESDNKNMFLLFIELDENKNRNITIDQLTSWKENIEQRVMKSTIWKSYQEIARAIKEVTEEELTPIEAPLRFAFFSPEIQRKIKDEMTNESYEEATNKAEIKGFQLDIWVILDTMLKHKPNIFVLDSSANQQNIKEKILNTTAISPSTLISDIPLPKSYVGQQEKEMPSNRSTPSYTHLAGLGLGGLVVKSWLSIQKKIISMPHKMKFLTEITPIDLGLVKALLPMAIVVSVIPKIYKSFSEKKNKAKITPPPVSSPSSFPQKKWLILLFLLLLASLLVAFYTKKSS